MERHQVGRFELGGVAELCGRYSDQGCHVSPEDFAATFSTSTSKSSGVAAFGLLSTMDEEARERNKQYRLTAVRFLHNPFFLTKVFVSSICQRPLTRFMYWVQKMHGEEHKRLTSTVAFQPTMVSKLVQEKSEFYEKQISDMLADDAVEDTSTW